MLKANEMKVLRKIVDKTKIAYLSMEPWAAAKRKLSVSVAVPPAPVRVPSQRPLASSVASVANDKVIMK